MTVSWWTLEQYALDTLSADQRQEIERALAHDPEAQRRLAAIEDDDRAPPPLQLGPDSGLPLPDPLPPRRPHRFSAGFTTVLAVAAALVAVVIGTRGAPDVGLGEPLPGEKGGELVLRVQTAQGRTVEPGDHVPAGTAVQAFVTWAGADAEGRLHADGTTLWSGVVRSGNRRRIPGAWTLTEGPVSLCVDVDVAEACVPLVGVPAP